MHRASHAAQSRDRKHSSRRPCAASFRGHGDAAARHQFDRCRRGSASQITGGDDALRQGRLRPLVGNRAALGREAAMLSDDAERYIELRRTLGFKLRKPSRHLQSFARFASEKGETYVSAATALEWATMAPTRGARHRRLGDVGRLALFLRAENAKHEVPVNLFTERASRPVPYIYTQDELARILDAAGQLRRQKPNPLRQQLYVMLFGLIAATGLRVSEALELRLGDILAGGVLYIRATKFGKSRLVPLPPTVVEALDRYLDRRRLVAGSDDHLFPSVKGKVLASSTVN